MFKKRIRILIVEDNKAVLQTTAECLRSELKDLGITADIHFAEDGFEAIPLCRQMSYDLILMDMIMKKIHGEETIRKIRSNINGKNARIAILSGYEDNEAIPKCVEEKLVDNKIFYKPVDFQQLAKYIQENV